MVNSPIDSGLSHFTSFRFGQLPQFQASNSGEKGAMTGVLITSFFTGVGEEKTAANGSALVEKVFSDPKALQNFLNESHVGALRDLLESLGWDIRTLGKGGHAGQGMRALEVNEEGNLTGRAISFHPGGGHHGPSAYWKVSSPQRGIVRVGPQFP
jgi:hypothetical protein